ncbi:MAG TPA: hypothetical protein VMN99_04695 [Anaerolineales bacterium]|nr:hypothetical protein [Anaerolineales bacterium]
MDFNWSILGWIAGLVFVYLFGLFEGRNQGYKKRKAEEGQEKKDQSPPLPAQPETSTVDDPGILRIKNENGSFALDLDGTRVNPISLSSDHRRRLIEMLNIMRPWLEGRSAPASAPAIKPPAPPPATPPTTLDERLAAIGSTSTENKPAAPQPKAPPSEQTAQPPPSRSSTFAKEDRPSAPANSIVRQIDTILQSRLAGTHLEERGVFLTQSPEGGVMVYIGLTRYNGIDEVPDAEIKAAIRAATAEWENKYTPGL